MASCLLYGLSVHMMHCSVCKITLFIERPLQHKYSVLLVSLNFEVGIMELHVLYNMLV